MRNAETYLHTLPFYRYLDALNEMLTRAISVRVEPTFTDEDRAWFRAPVKESVAP